MLPKLFEGIIYYGTLVPLHIFFLIRYQLLTLTSNSYQVTYEDFYEFLLTFNSSIQRNIFEVTERNIDK